MPDLSDPLATLLIEERLNGEDFTGDNKIYGLDFTIAPGFGRPPILDVIDQSYPSSVPPFSGVKVRVINGVRADVMGGGIYSDRTHFSYGEDENGDPLDASEVHFSEIEPIYLEPASYSLLIHAKPGYYPQVVIFDVPPGEIVEILHECVEVNQSADPPDLLEPEKISITGVFKKGGGVLMPAHHEPLYDPNQLVPIYIETTIVPAEDLEVVRLTGRGIGVYDLTYWDTLKRRKGVNVLRNVAWSDLIDVFRAYRCHPTLTPDMIDWLKSIDEELWNGWLGGYQPNPVEHPAVYGLSGQFDFATIERPVASQTVTIGPFWGHGTFVIETACKHRSKTKMFKHVENSRDRLYAIDLKTQALSEAVTEILAMVEEIRDNAVDEVAPDGGT